MPSPTRAEDLLRRVRPAFCPLSGAVALLGALGALTACERKAETGAQPGAAAGRDAGAFGALLKALDAGLDAGPPEPEGDELARGPGGKEEARVVLKGTSLLAERLDGTRAPMLLAPSAPDDADAGPWDIGFADVDGDGRADVLVGRPEQGAAATRYDAFLFGARSGHAPPYLTPDLTSAHWLWSVPSGKSPDEIVRTMPKERFEAAEIRALVTKPRGDGGPRGAREVIGAAGRVYVFEGTHAVASRLTVAKADVPVVACLPKPGAACALEVTCDAGRSLCRASVRDGDAPKPCAERVFWPAKVSGVTKIVAVAASSQGC